MGRFQAPTGDRSDGRALQFAGRRIPLPGSRFLRIGLGASLFTGGLLAFLPILGLWMLPLGAMVLSVDLPPVRRARRRLVVFGGRSELVGWLSTKLSRKS